VNPTEPSEELFVLTLDVIEDDEQLEAWADDFIRRDALDADTWRLAVEIDARVTQRWSDLASVLVRYGFEAGRRHPCFQGT